MKDTLLRFLQHPKAKGLNIDDPQTTIARRDIINSKTFLKKIYHEWYQIIQQNLPVGDGGILELGSGAGFIKNLIPEVITSDVLDIDGVDIKIADDGLLPFPDSTLRAIVMTDVLHHISEPRSFFVEAGRVVRSGGSIVMIEPWVTKWSTFVYSHLHSEPFHPKAEKWEFAKQGPLSGANGALPWIIFVRDRDFFENEFPEWQIRGITPLMPFVYLLSGGLSLISFLPGTLYGTCRAIEKGLGTFGFNPAMFAVCILERK